jgi:hypothetical protein
MEINIMTKPSEETLAALHRGGVRCLVTGGDLYVLEAQRALAKQIIDARWEADVAERDGE